MFIGVRCGLACTASQHKQIVQVHAASRHKGKAADGIKTESSALDA